MVTNFSSPIKGQNNGSCNRLTSYLDKEQTGERFFGATQEQVSKVEVIQAIDQNGQNQGLKKEHDRFYSFTIDPSQAELHHIGEDSEKLKAYTRQVMDNYAANFNKGVKSDDLVWYARIEHSRQYTHTDQAVQEGTAQKGQPKEGEQTHVHVVVSRFEQRGPETDRSRSLSPQTNHRQASEQGVRSGFDRVNFIQANEQSFDRQFSYERSQGETFQHARTRQHGTQAERLQIREAEIKTQIERQRSQPQQTRQREESQQQNHELNR